MRHCFAVGALALAALVATSVAADEALESGPKVGKNIPGPFNPLHVTGEGAGQKLCLV